MKSGSHETESCSLNHLITFKFDWFISSTAAEVPVKFQWSHNSQFKSYGFEALRDLTIRPLIWFWIMAVLILHICSQYHSCWWPGDERSQGISSHCIHLVVPEYSGSAPDGLTLNVRGPSYLGLTRSISWLLLTSPGHQQPWYWLCRICRSWSYSRKDFKYLCHINVE